VLNGLIEPHLRCDIIQTGSERMVVNACCGLRSLAGERLVSRKVLLREASAVKAPCASGVGVKMGESVGLNGRVQCFLQLVRKFPNGVGLLTPPNSTASIVTVYKYPPKSSPSSSPA
jgi:hypothetical protein